MNGELTSAQIWKAILIAESFYLSLAAGFFYFVRREWRRERERRARDIMS